MMFGKAWAGEMASYNQWQDVKLLALCDAIGEDARREDRGMFFGNIHHTLDHILMVDRLLFEFALTGRRPDKFEPEVVLVIDYAQLADEQRSFDAALCERFKSADDAWFEVTAKFYSRARKDERDLPRYVIFSQLFNHATHHRSQVASELHRLGIDYGNTDMPHNPFSTFHAPVQP